MKKMRTLFDLLSWVLVGLLIIVSQNLEAKAISEIQTYEKNKDLKLPTATPEAVKQWRYDRFGLFIHWGPISQVGKQLSHSMKHPLYKPTGKISPEEYTKHYKTFNPVKYDPDAIVKFAKKIGTRYLVFTAKHHAGFSMFDSAVTDYDIINTPYKKDLLKQLEQACRKNDYQFGFYYSPRDWTHPDCNTENHARYIKFYKDQMKELLSNYGSIYAIWFDGMGPGDWGNTSAEVMGMIREKHPGAMVNDRGGAGADFYTTEHMVGHFNRKQNWEVCETTTSQWGYNPDTKARKIEQLMAILLYTWGADGNMLLNIGPMGDGSMNPDEVQVLEKVADWWAVHGEASIRGTRGGPYFPGSYGVSTCKDNQVYLHVFNWPANHTWTFPALPGRKVKSARTLSGGKAVIKQNNDQLVLSVNKKDIQPIVTTVELTLDKEAFPVKPLAFQKNLVLDAKIKLSEKQDGKKYLIDQDATTSWHIKKTKEKPWVELDFGKEVTIESINCGRGEEWDMKTMVEILVPDGSGKWKSAYKNKIRFEPIDYLKKNITSDKVRIQFSSKKNFHLAELELYSPI
jgi:alpha-L-fucosidase